MKIRAAIKLGLSTAEKAQCTESLVEFFQNNIVINNSPHKQHTNYSNISTIPTEHYEWGIYRRQLAVLCIRKHCNDQHTVWCHSRTMTESDSNLVLLYSLCFIWHGTWFYAGISNSFFHVLMQFLFLTQHLQAIERGILTVDSYARYKSCIHRTRSIKILAHQGIETVKV